MHSRVMPQIKICHPDRSASIRESESVREVEGPCAFLCALCVSAVKHALKFLTHVILSEVNRPASLCALGDLRG